MAPWPETGNEPKAPDKNSESDNNSVKSDRTKISNSTGTDSDIPDRVVQEAKLVTPKMVQDVNQKTAQDVQNALKPVQDVSLSSKLGHGVQPVDSLDEDGLKSLLEEAITYKSPKDKDTKSALFQNLLIEAEKNDDSDQTDDDSSSIHYQPLGQGQGRAQTQRGTRKRLNRRDSDRQRSGGSLQNLACWHAGTGKLSSRGSVSARQREGGSLPTNVNQSCADDAAAAAKDDALCNYTSRATLHVSPVDSPISIPITSSKVASSVVNGVEHTPLQLHSNYNAVKSVVGCETALRSGTSSENPTQHVSTCFLPISPQQPSTGGREADVRQYTTYPKDSGGECKMKSLDENGNALGTANRVETSTSDRKVKRKKKNYRNIVNAENIEGHRWDEDIDSLMKYINSGSAEECKSHKSKQSNTPVALMKGARAPVSKLKSKEDEGRKRRGKEAKIHKSNSMEEISKTKLEDLTSPSEKTPEDNIARVKPKKQVTLDDAQLEASCWQTEENLTQSVSVEKIVIDKDKKKLDKKQESFTDLQDAEFHLVKKKQRKKKRQVTNYGRRGSSKASNSGYYGNQGFPSHYRRSAQVIQKGVQSRRKSASSVPPSDKSDSSDLDSVHSLPVSSTTPKPNVGKTSTSGGSTPQASYADITRSMITPPRAPCIIKTMIGLRSSGVDDDRVSATMSPPPPQPPLPPTPPPPPPPPPPLLLTPLRKDAMTDTDSDMILLPVEEYPPLARKAASGDYFVEFTVKRGRATRDTDVSVEETVILKSSVQSRKDLSDKVDSDFRREPLTVSKQTTVDTAGKRPPVILLNRSGRSSPQQTLDVTFGFDINQELLAESEQLPTSCQVTKEGYDHTRTVQFIKSEWDHVMRLYNSNARSDREESQQPQVQYYKP